MSQILLIAADKPLPLCDHQKDRESTVTHSGKTYTISFAQGFLIAEHRYYRQAVDELDYPIKPYQYELEMEQHETDLRCLCQYLAENFTPGEEVELWNIWLGERKRPPHFCGSLADLDKETLEQFLRPPIQDGPSGQCWLTITI